MSWVSTTTPRATKLYNSADVIKSNIINDYNDDWSEQLKKYRRVKNLTQIELANKIGVKFFTLRSWEQKKAKPPYEKWKLINDLLRK